MTAPYDDQDSPLGVWVAPGLTPEHTESIVEAIDALETLANEDQYPEEWREELVEAVDGFLAQYARPFEAIWEEAD